MHDGFYPIAFHQPLQEGYVSLGLRTGWKTFVPGQFGMLAVPPCHGVLLRRPFSFARQHQDVTEILYKKVGKGTHALGLLTVGHSLGLLGPLGKGFSIPEGSGERVGVAGGYGVAPFLELASQLLEQGQRLHLFYGAKTKNDLVYIQELKQLNVNLYLTTIDGSAGEKGLVTDAFARHYATAPKPLIVWSCGPMGLLKTVQAWSEAQGVYCEISVEERMGCGTGVCLGCVIPDREGHYLRACTEGPVFSGKRIDLRVGQ